MEWVLSPFWRWVVISFTFWAFIGWGLIAVWVVRLWARGLVVRRITFTFLYGNKDILLFLYKEILWT